MNVVRIRLLPLAFSLAAAFDSAAAQDADFLESLHADVRRMELDSNEARADALQTILREFGIEYSLEEFEIAARRDYPRTTGTNIVVTLGDGPADIVVGAHYDAVWLRDGSLSAGAVDNAASAIILTRVADALSDRNLGRHRIRIVFFDMEEIGLLGSRDFVARHADDTIAHAINLDVNGYGDTIFYGPMNDRPADALSDAMQVICSGADFSCRGFGRYPASDYISFQRAGISFLSLAILPAAEVDELYAALHPAEVSPTPPAQPPRILTLIHSPEDRATRVDPAGMAVTYRGVLALIAELDRQ